MKLATSIDNSGFVIKNNIYVGSTGLLITGALVRNYSYVNKNTLREITTTPLPAYSLTGSGSFSSLVYETCHGINYSSAVNAGKTGDYNFYMAPYAPGYYQPPVGELPTFAEQTFGFSKLRNKQAEDLNLSDYLKIFGLRIASKINNFIPCKNYNLTAFHEGITDCPINSKMAFKYSEVQAELAAGTYLGSIGGNIYNHNPIPSSYDRGVLVATTLYKSAPPTGPKVTKENQDSCFYVTGQDEKPIPYFSRGASDSSSNYVFGKCANLSEIDRQPLAVGAVDGHTNASVGNPKDILSDGDLGQDTSNYDQSIYWNFVFKNNHESLPFANTHEAVQMTQDNDTVREDYWWEHRECPENIDYLNHAFGNNINACPMNYLDVPYYAAIGKFGYFGTRFQDTWRKISNEFGEPVGWIDTWNLSGYESLDVLNPPTIIDPEWIESPEDNSLYKITGTWHEDPIVTGQDGNGDDLYEPIQYNYFNSTFYVNSGVEPTVVVARNVFTGLLLAVDPDNFVGIDWNGPDLSSTPSDPGVLSSLGGLVYRQGGNFFPNVDLNLLYYKKKKYIDYPYQVGAYYKVIPDSEYAPYSLNLGGSDYDPLIKASAIEKKYYDFAFSDRTLFLSLNYNLSRSSPEYSFLTNAGIKGFEHSYGALCSGATGLGFKVSDSKDFKISYINRGGSDLFGDDPTQVFIDSFISTGLYDPTNLIQFNELIKKYGSFKLSSHTSIDSQWYDKITNEKRKRIAKSYYSSIANGQPVDLFPNNQVTFSFEKTSDFAASDFVKYGSIKNSAKAVGKTLPEVKRQYFSAGFSTLFEASGSFQRINHKVSNDTINNIPLKGSSFDYSSQNVGYPKVTHTVSKSFVKSYDNFYLGYANPRGCGNENFVVGPNSYLDLINLPNGGIWKDYAPETSPPPPSADNSPTRASWRDGGFARIGRLNRNFSCFSPMFLQQPLNDTVKLCQAPKFRVYAVDYHTIPEDKIKENSKTLAYPEVDYWLRKIKAINTKGDNLYPLAYQWYRIHKGNAKKYLETKDAKLLDPSSPTGTWCCAEDGFGRTSDCTVIRPTQCLDINGAPISSWSHSEDSVRRFMGVNHIDSAFFYFCNVTGRFGWRSSEFASVTVDTRVKIEVATMNLCGPGSATVSIAGTDAQLGLMNGFISDKKVYFEQVKDTNWNDRNNCETVRFVGPERMRGVTRVYTPSTFVDSRGKRVRSAHWKDFGALVSASVALSEPLAISLYADRALPYCDRALGASATWKGVPIILKNFIHRTHYESAVLTENTSFGVKANKLRSIAELYPPRRYTSASPIPDWDGKNPGHHQFETNLGSIKKYSKNTAENLKVDNGPYGPVKNLEILPASVSNIVSHAQDLMLKFNKAIFLDASSKIITGPECGYTAPTFGRLMHFYVESLFTYYLLCEVGGVKPKKVKNFSHIAGGLRTGRAGLQYNWLGKPNDSRLKRVSMPGPYAFQWKVERHNRDRSGNGMPLSFWSYNYEKKIDDLYDAAAVYGAVKKTNLQYDGLSQGQKTLRQNMANTMYGLGSVAVTLRGASIGPDDGPKLGCGSIRWRASGEMGGDKPNTDFVKYMQGVAGVGPDPFSVYGCSGPDATDCFYPCVSLKYPEGFTPRGGKNLGYANGSERHYVTSSITKSSNYPATVPGATKTYKVFSIDLSPCSTNKKDICNYLTPTVHVGIDTWPVAKTSNIFHLITSISNL